MRSWQKHLWAWIAIAMALLVLIGGMDRAVDLVYTEQFVATNIVGEIATSASAGQTFTAEYLGLTRIEMRLDTYGRLNSGPLSFHLMSWPDAAEDLVVLTVDAADVSDGYYAFEFPPLQNQIGQQFYFYLEAPHIQRGVGIAVWGTNSDVYAEGAAILRGLPDSAAQDLTFRLGYDLPLHEEIGIFWSRLVQDKPSVWGNQWFPVLLLFFYLCLLYILVARFAKGFRGTDG